MSFFKDFKEDLSQAVNELMPEEEAARETVSAVADQTEESPTQSDDYSDLFASFDASETESTPEPAKEEPEEEYEEVVEEIVEEVEVGEDYDGDDEEVIEEVIYVDEEGNPVDEDGNPIGEVTGGTEAVNEIPEADTEDNIEYDTLPEMSDEVETADEENIFGDGPINTVTTPIFGETKKEDAPINTIWGDNQKVTAGTIIKGMTVNGNISSEGSLDVHGLVEGNIEIKGKLSITGKVQGDSKADEIFVNGAKIVGGLFSNNSVKVAGGSVIKGNIKASAAVVAGAVKGDIDIQGPVILDATAVIVGNIKSKSIQINNGAVIEGSCSQCYSDVTATNYFDEEE